MSDWCVMQGAAVGFSGSKVYCLQESTICAYDVPLSASVHDLLNAGDLEQAFQVSRRLLYLTLLCK